jgi:hypothetical protein
MPGSRLDANGGSVGFLAGGGGGILREDVMPAPAPPFAPMPGGLFAGGLRAPADAPSPGLTAEPPGDTGAPPRSPPPAALAVDSGATSECGELSRALERSLPSPPPAGSSATVLVMCIGGAIARDSDR